MRGLLVRIFLAMVLTSSLASLAMVLVYSDGFERHRKHDMHLVDTTLRYEGELALRGLASHGRGAADAQLESLGSNIGLTVALTSSTGEVIAGRIATDAAEVRRLAASVRSGAPVHTREVHAVRLRDAVVLATRHGTRDRVPLSPPTMQLVLVVLFGAVISLILSRWLAGPLQTLRSGTERLAAGGGAVRVVPAMPRLADAEVLDLARDFDRMAARIEGLLESRERLLRDVSHELRSPLARLTVALELARERAGADAKGALDRIEKEAERLGELIGLVLTMARLEQATELEHPEDLRLDELVAAVHDDAAFEAEGAGRAVTLTSLPAVTVRGNEELLRRALENVVRNALRWTPEGARVDLELRPAGEVVRFVVRDHGPGVPEEALEQIFLPFARVQAARDRASGGAGLGLAIAARAVRLHGGRVEAANHPEGGLEVTIELPRSDLR